MGTAEEKKTNYIQNKYSRFQLFHNPESTAI